MRERIKIVVGVRPLKVRDEMHIDAVMRYPHRVTENRRAYKRSRDKARIRAMLRGE